ncbi:long-chain-fatty-acid--[acyl-carrier-protein] ligase AEE15, chloroplastic isoform X1 [Amborella trichopoda]|uniref:long-chain-fatty-acid--[acyl-carrier-protein] ligase AEE15, chloroplastic isoform X1 n=1 Tax=Amborella trichopoda TaxID=13333 RepID=UPI0009BFC94C|nr:long-chain-fatty-acid--[acyl-carrier-protein] ligase AEE15, chloroplastic isoform X1 [Amborella trichopoda]|eukprot:XP_011620348.2 long-chain-fatty-acid--[acyl-carrier-protein] ligase AEE15, chloroplastic isoform X1 [Amborella trichopoda]
MENNVLVVQQLQFKEPQCAVPTTQSPDFFQLDKLELASMVSMAMPLQLKAPSISGDCGDLFKLPTSRCLDKASSVSIRSYSGRCFHHVRRFEVFCEAQPEIKVLHVKKCSPLLESTLLSGSNFLTPTWKAVPDIWKSSADKYGDQVALVDPYHDPPSKMTYKQLEQEILNFAEGLRVAGIFPDEKIALFADNSCRWLVADQGTMATGAINVVRGSRSSVEELLQIYTHSESVALIVDNPDLFNKIARTLSSRAMMRFVVLLWGEKSSCDSQLMDGMQLYSYKEIINLGQKSRGLLASYKGHSHGYVAINPKDIATLVYTSGTTGVPKGVMLTHQNLLHQIKNLWDIVPTIPGDRFLSMLPPWHVYERAAEYFIFTCGIEQVYTTVKNLKEDLQRYQPHYLISVPLVYETLYGGIQKQISVSSRARKTVAYALINISLTFMEFKRIYEGKALSQVHIQHSALVSFFDWLWARTVAAFLWPLHLLAVTLVYSKIHSSIGISKAGISGGGSMPLHVDKFFEAIGINLQNGYGLTESSPVVAARLPDCNVLGTVGPPLPYTEIKVVDPETDVALPDGSKGIVKVRGPQVMKGYYKNPTSTREVLDDESWLNTGDIGWIAPRNSTGRSRRCGGLLILEGRAKDTIVLTTGENVEPSVIEEAALQSSLIHQIVVIGQDQRRLGALIVPNKDELLLVARKLLKSNDPDVGPSKELLNSVIRDELKHWTSDCSFQIGPFLLLEEPLTIDSGLLTPTMKIRRDKVMDRFRDEISKLYR